MAGPVPGLVGAAAGCPAHRDSPGQTRTKEHQMTSNARPGNRIVGSLRTADGKGVVRMQDRFDTGIDDLWSARPTPAVWPAGSASSRATCAWAVSSAPAFLTDGKAPGG